MKQRIVVDNRLKESAPGAHLTDVFRCQAMQYFINRPASRMAEDLNQSNQKEIQ